MSNKLTPLTKLTLSPPLLSLVEPHYLSSKHQSLIATMGNKSPISTIVLVLLSTTIFLFVLSNPNPNPDPNPSLALTPPSLSSRDSLRSTCSTSHPSPTLQIYHHSTLSSPQSRRPGKDQLSLSSALSSTLHQPPSSYACSSHWQSALFSAVVRF